MAVEVTERRVWSLAIMCLAPLMVMWALTNPLFASPDETAHMVRAQGFSRLDFSAPYETDGIPISEVECFRFQPNVTAECMNLTWGPDGTEIDVPVDGYPPLLHVVAAVPVTFLSGLTGAYAMRIALVVVNAGLLAWAFSLALAGGRWRLTGLALGMTPMVLFTSSTVNPSGLTAAGAALAVCGALALREVRGNRQAEAAAVIGALIVVGARRDGAFWMAAIAAGLWLWSRHPQLRQTLRQRLRNSAARLAPVVALLMVGSWWAVPYLWRLIAPGSNARGDTWQATRDLYRYFLNLIGYFGWLDTPLGREPLLLAAVATGSLILIAFTVTHGYRRLALIFATCLHVAVPIGFGTFRFPYFQGRYLFPIWILLMILAGDAIGRAHRRGQLGGLRPAPILIIWLAVHIWALATNLKRYAIGESGNWWDIQNARWHPPGIGNVVVLLLLLPVAVVTALAMRSLLNSIDEDRVATES